MSLITLDDIFEAQARIAGVAYRTPLLPIPAQSEWNGTSVYLKPENFQPIGSFKIRGAYNRIAALSQSERARGVIAYSSGNHAQGVAYSARALGIPATIVMPQDAPSVKIAATRGYGANVVLYDPQSQSREQVADEVAHGKGWTLVPPFDDPYIIAGQGTIGAEIYADLPDVDLVLVCVGGGGLLGGIATALKTLNPKIRVIGVEPEMADDARQSFEAGRVVSISYAQAGRTIADGVRTLHLSNLTFSHIQHYADAIITVSEDEIRSAMRRLILDHKLVPEPAGALPYAAWLFRRDHFSEARRVALIVSGGNIEPSMLATLI